MAQFISKEVCKEYIYRYIYPHYGLWEFQQRHPMYFYAFYAKKGHHNARGAFGRCKETTRELLGKGYKIWSSKTELRRQL